MPRLGPRIVTPCCSLWHLQYSLSMCTKKARLIHHAIGDVCVASYLGMQDGSHAVYGLVEEFLELSRRLSVQTIRDLVAAVHKRIPPMFLERRICTLC